jgi:hypothetical protein
MMLVFRLLGFAAAAAGLRTAAIRTSEYGNTVFRPAVSSHPKAIVHFLGGAFVGAAPQVAYSNFLEQLVDAGYVVIATPFELRFDYLGVCDRVLTTAEPAHCALVQEYGDLPLIGIGHSCGALLHVLLSSAFRGTGGLADIPRAANVLISFNNKRANDAIPLLGELVAPAASVLLGVQRDPRVQPLQQVVAASRKRLEKDMAGIDGLVGASGSWQQLLPMIDQLDAVLRDIEGGTAEFTPTPEETRRSVASLYKAERTLVVRFSDDALDESASLPALLGGTGSVELASCTGTHLTPLALANAAEASAGSQQESVPSPLSVAAGLVGARGTECNAALVDIISFIET